MNDAIDVLGATTVMLGSGVIVDTPGNYLIEITPGKFEHVFGIDDNDRGCGGRMLFSFERRITVVFFAIR